jgi:hypothetical protein
VVTESVVSNRCRQRGRIAAGVLLASARQSRRTLLIIEHAMAAIVAGVIILPFQPFFAAILAIGVVPLIAYPYCREVRAFASWWAGVSRPLLIVAGWRASRLLSPQLLHCRCRSAEPMKRLAGGTTPTMRPCSHWLVSLRPAVGQAGAS